MLVFKIVLRIPVFGLLVSSIGDGSVWIQKPVRQANGGVVKSALLVRKVCKGQNKRHKRESHDSNL